MSAWQQQKLDDLRRALAAHLEKRAALAAAGEHEQAKRLDGEITEHCTAITEIERALRTAP
jgi:hypothetical protein